MRQYEDPQQYLNLHLEQAAEKYVRGLGRAGLQPNAKLTRAMAERAAREAEAGYIQHATEVRDHNLQVILKDHRSRMNTIKREGARMRLKVCLPIAVILGLLAWYSFTHPGGFIAGAYFLYAIGALAFLAMVVLGAIFDRPTS